MSMTAWYDGHARIPLLTCVCKIEFVIMPADFWIVRKRMIRKGGGRMKTRVATLSIIVEDTSSVEKLNALLHEYGEYIIGRMGLPYRKCGIHIISVAIDAPQDVINALSGKIGKVPGVNSKIAFSSVVSERPDEERGC